MLYRHPSGTIGPLPQAFSTEAGEMLNFHLVENPQDFGFVTFAEEAVPAFDPATHKASPRDLDDDEARTTTRVWDIVALTPEEIEANRPPVPETISDRQFAQQLAIVDAISEEEAEDWVGPGTVPPAMMALVDLLPAEQRFSARMLLKGATSFERSHPLTGVLAAHYGWSATETDDFWRAAALL